MTPTKMTTPEQQRQFHIAMTGKPECFPDCCFCKVLRELKELKIEFENQKAITAMLRMMKDEAVDIANKRLLKD